MRRTIVIFSLAAALGLGACGYGNDSEGASGSAQAGATQPSDGQGPIVAAGQTSLGEALTDGQGLTLYGLTDDTDGTSTCVDACAQTWPPLTVPSAELPAGLDPDVYSVVPRADGSFQLRAGPWPLYRFSGDSAPGDTNGQGSGGVWFVASPSGELIRGESSADGSDAGAGEPVPSTEPGGGDDGTGSSDDGSSDDGSTGGGSGEDTGYGDDSSSDDGPYGGGGYGDDETSYEDSGYVRRAEAKAADAF
jgi:predicted lipoprotein with Yx(FWY)xxD motif